LYKIEPDLTELENMDSQAMAVETHGMNPLKVLSMARSMGVEFRRMILVGCEPGELDDDEEGRLGLSAPVSASVNEAASMVESIIHEALDKSAQQTLNS
ncbi:MAG: hypothetical protein ACREQW_19630, partial [Candidatus Binatia bacterium]